MAPVPEELRVPDNCESAAVVEWHVREGESFGPDTQLVDLAGPDGFLTLTSTREGKLVDILVPAGSPVDPGETLALLKTR